MSVIAGERHLPGLAARDGSSPGRGPHPHDPAVSAPAPYLHSRTSHEESRLRAGQRLQGDSSGRFKLVYYFFFVDYLKTSF